MSVTIDDCLPAELRGATLTRFASGLSGAEVYRVDAPGRALVLKVAANADPAEWRARLAVLQLAADAGLAPRVVHVDAARRAIVSELVVDRGFAPYLFTPATRAQAITELGHTLARVHRLAIPEGAVPAAPHAFLARIGTSFAPGYLPSFARAFVDRMLAEVPPSSTDPLVMSHNDVNPTNTLFDGERIVLLDWDMAAPNDRYYDLAAISLFMRFDDASSLALLAAHDGVPVTALPERFTYLRRLIAALCGSIFVHLARNGGHAGATSEASLPLAELYAKLRSGQLDVASPDGQFQMGLGLIKAGSS
jgi:aminoglycoside phosphotransferase (APT) family kinase protein